MANLDLQKNCFVCNENKDIELFYKHTKMADGHLNKCIDCCKQYEKNRRIVCDAPRINDARRYYKNDHRKTKIRKSDEKWRYNDDNKKVMTQKQKDFRAKNPEKYKARTIVRGAIRNGSLVRKNCSVCGDKKSQAHHPNYNEPLNVVWLCSACHGKEHRKYDVEKLFM